MAKDKLLAEWFWTDRWMGSSAFLLPLEARGLYREMLTQAWRRGAELPADEAAIKRACGVTDDEWDRSWPLVQRYFKQNEAKGVIYNETQVEIYRETMLLKAARSKAGRRGGLTAQSLKRQAKLEANAQATPEAKINPPSLSLSPSLSPSPSPNLDTNIRVMRENSVLTTSEQKAAATPPLLNIKILTKIAHEVLKKTDTPREFSSVKEDIKQLCAQRQIAFTAESVGAAVESAWASRRAQSPSRESRRRHHA